MLNHLQNTIAKGSLFAGSLLLILFSFNPIHANNRKDLHDFHVCITRIEHNPQTHSLEITLKVFTDDLEQTLEDQGAPRLFIGGEREHTLTDSLIQAYLFGKLSLTVNGQSTAPTFVGKEVEMDVTWCYLEIPEIDQPTEMTVRNQVLMDRFEDQMNLVHVYVKGEKHSFALKQNRYKESLSF